MTDRPPATVRTRDTDIGVLDSFGPSQFPQRTLPRARILLLDETMDARFITVDDNSFHCLVSEPADDSAEAVILLHGWPQTAGCWRDVIPRLHGPDADARYRVVAPDLRGYGLSDKPADGYDKRSMAWDILGIMDSLGIDRAHFVGHDRGGRVAHRLALDSPERVATLTVLDIAPTHAMFTNGRMRTAEGYFHWLLHMQKDLPEALTAGRTAEYLRYFFERWTVRRDRLDPHIDDYVRAFEQPGAMRAAFDDYRATHEDVAVDEEDFRAQRKLTMPVLALWGAGGLAANTDIATVWESYTEQVDGRAIPDCGHFIPEEAPETLVSELREFWSQSR